MENFKEVLMFKEKISSQKKGLKKELSLLKKEFKADKSNFEFSKVSVYLNSRIERLDKALFHLNLALEDKKNSGKETSYFVQMVKEARKELKTYNELTEDDTCKELLEKLLSNTTAIKL